MMKKMIFSVLALTFLFGCSKEMVNVNDFSKGDLMSSCAVKDSLKLKFAKILSIALNQNSELRTLLKNEALKRFDNDDDVLYQLIRDNKVGDQTVSEYLSKYAESKDEFKFVEDNLPLLTILVPTLPNFSLDSWDASKEVPKVAVRLDGKGQIPLFDLQGKRTQIPTGAIPGFPVLVVKENERVCLASDGLKSASIIANAGRFRYQFIDNSFDGSKKLKSLSLPMGPGTTDPANFVAYNSGVEWHRDNVYYSLTPTNTRGAYRPNYCEYLTSFTLKNSWYTKISDQTGDPSIVSESWTDGAFEFQITMLINSTNGVGATLTKFFTAKGTDLTSPSYIITNIRGDRYYHYQTNNIVNKRFNPNLELLSWDLKNYGSTWKISISEVDDTEEYSHNEEVTTQYASNFEITGSVEKVGLKFGATATITNKSSFSVKTTKNSDDLGSALLNFYDPIVISTTLNYDRRTGTYITSCEKYEITTGYADLCIEPRKIY